MSEDGLKVVEDGINMDAPRARRSKKSLLDKIKRKRVIYVIDPSDDDHDGVDVEVELREPTHAERQELLRDLTNKSESKKGRKELRAWGISAADFQNLGMICHVAYEPGTEQQFWTRNEIPDLLELPTTHLAPLQRAVFDILGIHMGPDVEEEDESGLGLTDGEKKP